MCLYIYTSLSLSEHNIGEGEGGSLQFSEVASPFHAITTVESVRTLFTCPVYTWLSEHVGEEEGGSLKFY